MRNKARLTTEQSNPAKKRLKLENTNYISIRESWDHPLTSAPKENKLEENKTVAEHPEKRQRRNEKTERLENLRRIPDKVYEGETIEDFEIHTTDWDKVLSEHKEKLERETEERTKQLEKQAAKEKSWELYRECKNFLETNEKEWMKRRLEREQEQKRTERLQIAEQKREELKEKI